MSEEIIGRLKEIKILQDLLDSPQPEFLAVYGRRRVGKTFLVREYFKKQNCLFLEVTGLKDGSLNDQLELFQNVMMKTFSLGFKLETPKRWRYAFEQLSVAIEKTSKNKRIVLFFDELPWLATPKSGLLQAIDYFWNTRWSTRKKLIFIACGSAASWILNHLIHAKGGLYNRVTARILLQPFSLKEAKEYLHYRKVRMDQSQVLQLYMVMGGIPQYLKYVKNGLSAAQNINQICFDLNGPLFDEFKNIFASLFDEPQAYLELVHLIAESSQGLSREVLVAKSSIHTSGGRLTKRLQELEQAGFISSFIPYGYKERGTFYKVIDEYALFYLFWIEPLIKYHKQAQKDARYWENLV